ncbi:hypothetical protein [Cellulomonas sp. URHB0016]
MAQRLKMPNPAWYAQWVDSGFTHLEIMDWYPLTTYRTHVPTVATRLIAAGWTSDDFREAIAQRLGGWPERVMTDADSAAREAVLWHEVSEFYRFRTEVALYARDDALRAARSLGATLAALARPSGWSKQRIEQLTRKQ